jgi:hypothetical protein
MFDAPIWIPNGFASSCMHCSRNFTLYWRKHHCRACGKIVCSTCSQNSFYLPHLNGERKARACDTCFSQIVRESRFRIDVPSTGALVSRRSGESVDGSQQTLFTPSSTYVAKLYSFTSKLSRVNMVEVQVLTQRVSLNCSLCLAPYSLLSWKVFVLTQHQCRACRRLICAGCCDQTSTCDACSKELDPMDIYIDINGGGWGYRPSS